MLKKSFMFCLMTTVSIVLLTACSPIKSESLTDVEIEATVNAIVLDNLEAQAQSQATIEAAVQATQIAVAAQITPPVNEYYTLTEEQLAAMIDEAVTVALEASEEVANSTSEVTYDNTVSEQEVVYVSYAVTYADEAVAYANSLLDTYYELYGVFADEAITAVYEIEAELESISNSLDAMEDLLYQGADAVNAALDEFNDTAQQMQIKLETVQEQTQQWKDDFQTAGLNRAEELMEIKPDREADNRSEMIDMINGFSEDIRNSLTDGTLNFQEIERISQSGANAQAAIEKFGGTQMQGWSDSINNLTRVAVQGNPVELKSMHKNFTVALPELNKRR